MELQKNEGKRDKKSSNVKKPIDKVWVFLLSDVTMAKAKRYEVHRTGITLRQGVVFSKKEVAEIAREFLQDSSEFGRVLSAAIVEEKIQAALSASA